MANINDGILREDMTEIVAMPTAETIGPAFERRRAMREKSIEAFFAEGHSSGSVRKADYVGASTASHGVYERVAHEFGHSFVAIPETFATFGKARSEPDDHSLTESWWHIERYAQLALFPGDVLQTRYIIAEINGVKREGVGMVIRKTSVPWLPRGYVVFAIIAEWSAEKGAYLPPVNPF